MLRLGSHAPVTNGLIATSLNQQTFYNINNEKTPMPKMNLQPTQRKKNVKNKPKNPNNYNYIQNSLTVNQRQHNKSNNNNNNNNKNRNKNNYNNHYNPTNPNSPWFEKVSQFEDCVSQTLYMSQTPRRKHDKSKRFDMPNSATNPLFWDSIGRAMGLYHDLITTPELNSDRVSKLVHLLHNGLRANRNQLTRMNKKPDYDSQSFHKEMTNYLCKSLRTISQDVLSNKVELNEYGAMHLITAFKELLLFEESVEIWKTAIDGTNNFTSNIFLNPRVVGVILPILYDNGVSYPEIQSLYEKSSSMINYFHPNLSVGMIRASLSAGQNEMALLLFQKLCQESTEMKYGYLIETHLSFIGECKDLQVAQTFFDKALNDEMPYKIDLQVSYVKSFLRNIWDQLHDFKRVYEIWYISSLHYGRNVNHGISSSLNDTFFDIFFKNFANDKINGFQALQNVIQTYNTVKSIDEPFFNIILTKCAVWRDPNVIDYIDKSYEHFKIPKTIVAYRILLKSMGAVEIATNEEILRRWMDLVIKSDEIGQKFIANADWAALRDATVTWAQMNSNNSQNINSSQNPMDQEENSILSNSMTENSTSSIPTPSDSPVSNASSANLFSRVPSRDHMDLSHPAFAALNASGAFDDIAAAAAKANASLNISPPAFDRIILYLKIVKCYSTFCRDSRQLTRLTSGTAVKYSCLQSALKNFSTLDVTDIPIPQLHNLKPSY